MTPLERRYRRLMLAYPRPYRAYRGEEIVSTLCDGARPRQRFPRLVEAIDLLAGGLRERLGGSVATPFAEGLRIALPVTLVLTAVAAASVHVDYSGPVGAPFLQPYVYAWAAALVAWAVAPGLGRVAILLSTLVTFRVAAMWSWRALETMLVCLLALLASYVALAAPPRATTVDRRGPGAVLWSRPGRLSAVAVAAGLGGFGAISQPTGESVLATLGWLPLVLIAVGVAARLRGQSGPLWAAAVLAPVPAAMILIHLRWLSWAWFAPLLPLFDAESTVFALPVTLAAAALIGYRSGRQGLLAASRVLTLASLVGMAGGLIALETAVDVWAVGVVIGAVLLAIAGLAAGVLPRVASWALLGLGAIAVLSDVAGVHREVWPWPLVALAFVALLAAVQAPARWPGGRWPVVVWSFVTVVIALGYVYKSNTPWYGGHSLAVWEVPISALALPACALAVVAAVAALRLQPVRATLTLVLGLGGVSALSAPAAAVAVIGGVSAASAVLAALAARRGQSAAELVTSPPSGKSARS